MNSIRILAIVKDTTVDGPGFRTAVYAAGCPHRCPGCHNPQSWDYNGGQMVPVEKVFGDIADAEFSGVTFSGGEPLEQPEAFAALARMIKERTGKDIWCYTGYAFEAVSGNPAIKELLQYVDVLVDGPYLHAESAPSLCFRGSSNQRLIDVRQSLRQGKTVEFVRSSSVSTFPASYKKAI